MCRERSIKHRYVYISFFLNTVRHQYSISVKTSRDYNHMIRHHIKLVENNKITVKR
jgi:hypothetical protein